MNEFKCDFCKCKRFTSDLIPSSWFKFKHNETVFVFCNTCIFQHGIQHLIYIMNSDNRNKNGNIHKSIELNQDRFKISPQLSKIFYKHSK